MVHWSINPLKYFRRDTPTEIGYSSDVTIHINIVGVDTTSLLCGSRVQVCDHTRMRVAICLARSQNERTTLRLISHLPEQPRRYRMAQSGGLERRRTKVPPVA